MDFTLVKKYLFKNVFSGLVKTLVTLGLSIIGLPFVISKIGIETFGIISIVLVFSSFSGILDFGLSKSLVVYSNNEKHREEISTIYFLNFSLFLFLSALGFIFYITGINLFGSKIDVDLNEIKLINFVSLQLLAFGILNNLYRANLEASYKLQIVNWGFLIQSFLINALWIILSYFDSDIFWFIISPVVSSICTLCFHLVSVKSIPFFFKIPRYRSIKEVLNTTFKFFKIGALNSLHLPLVKYLIILVIGESYALGVFELATKLAVICNNLLSYVSNPFFSLAAKADESERLNIWKIVKRSSNYIFLVTILGYILFLILNRPLIFYFFKDYSTEIFIVLNLTLVGYLAVALGEIFQKYYLGIGKVSQVINVKFFSVLLNIVLLLVLIVFNKLDLIWVSFSFSLSYISLGTFWFSKKLVSNPSQ